MSAWIRRSYDGVGVTQSPPGRYLAGLQEPYIGKVLLCIDVSGSMATRDDGKRTRLQQAVAGAERFVDEAFRAHYAVGIVLWHHDIAGSVPLTRDRATVLKALRRAQIFGDNDITPTLRYGIAQLGHLTGDRVLAIFGDGDIGPVKPAVALAGRAAALGIRIVVRGLGESATRQLRLIATDADDAVEVDRSATGIETGVAAMITSVLGGGLGRRRSSS